MLEPLKMNVNINDIYQYKLKSFFNSRALSINEEKFIFIDSGKNKEKVLSLHIKNNDFLFLSEWCDLFDFEKIYNLLSSRTKSNYFYFFPFLKIFFSLFMINTTECYRNKNLFVSYFINQLKNGLDFKDNPDDCKSELFNYLMYEIGIGSRYDKYFQVINNKLFFNIKNSSYVEVKKLINLIHSFAKRTARNSNRKYLEVIREFQLSTIDFLLDSTDNYSLPYSDIYIKYTYPDIFYNDYLENKNNIFRVLTDCVKEGQSKCNFFVSEMIFMNYIYYILREEPSNILALEEFCKENKKDFLKIISRIINRKFYLNINSFKGLNLGRYLSKI